MSIRIGKALVVDGDEKTRSAANNLLLNSARQPFDYASSLVEAVELLKRNNYVCVFAGSEIPSIAGEAPRRQDLENLLDEIDLLKGALKPPVVCLYTKATDIDDDIWTCWTTDMTLRGVVKWVRKPFPSSGRTPDRMLKKILSGQYVRLVKAMPLTPAELMAAPLRADDQPVGERLRPAHADSGAVEASQPAPMKNAEPVATMDAAAVTAKLQKIVDSKGGGKPSLLAALHDDTTQPTSVVPKPAKEDNAPTAQETPPSPKHQWVGIPNDPIELDDFMAKFCEQRTKDNRTCRKRALLAAARHKTVTLPSLIGKRKHGQPNRYLVHDLLAAWQGFIDEGVDLPPLLAEYAVDTSPSESTPGNNNVVQRT